MKWLLAGVVLFGLGGWTSFTWSQQQQENLLKLSQTCASEAEQFLQRPGSLWSGPLANPIYSTHYNRGKRECLMQLDGQAQSAPLRTYVDRSEVIDPTNGRSLLLFVRTETNFVVAQRTNYQLQGENGTGENSSSESEGLQLENEFHTKSLALMTQ